MRLVSDGERRRRSPKILTIHQLIVVRKPIEDSPVFPEARNIDKLKGQPFDLFEGHEKHIVGPNQWNLQVFGCF